jgi:hypothetical protein
MNKEHIYDVFSSSRDFRREGSAPPPRFAKIALVDAAQKPSRGFLVGGRAVAGVRELKRSS